MAEQLLARGDRVAGTVRKLESVGGLIIQLSSVGGQVAFPGGSLYHATKWGIEGFMDAVAQEVEVFGIGVTIVEPGGARTEFRYGSSQFAARPPIAAYDESPASHIRRTLTEKTSVPPGDPAKMVTLMVDSVDTQPAPRRIVLGSDAFTRMRTALKERLAAVEGQERLAASTDA